MTDGPVALRVVLGVVVVVEGELVEVGGLLVEDDEELEEFGAVDVVGAVDGAVLVEEGAVEELLVPGSLLGGPLATDEFVGACADAVAESPPSAKGAGCV